MWTPDNLPEWWLCSEVFVDDIDQSETTENPPCPLWIKVILWTIFAQLMWSIFF